MVISLAQTVCWFYNIKIKIQQPSYPAKTSISLQKHDQKIWVESFHGENGKRSTCNCAVVTFNRLQVVHSEFEALATSDYPHRVPLIIIEA